MKKQNVEVQFTVGDHVWVMYNNIPTQVFIGKIKITQGSHEQINNLCHGIDVIDKPIHIRLNLATIKNSENPQFQVGEMLTGKNREDVIEFISEQIFPTKKDLLNSL